MAVNRYSPMGREGESAMVENPDHGKWARWEDYERLSKRVQKIESFAESLCDTTNNKLALARIRGQS